MYLGTSESEIDFREPSRGFSFLGTDAGHTNCVSVFALDGRLLLQRSSVLEPRGRSGSCPGGSLFAELAESRASAMGFDASWWGKRQTQGFYLLTPTLGEVLQTADGRDRLSEIGNGSRDTRLFSEHSQFTDSAISILAQARMTKRQILARCNARHPRI